MPVYFRNHSNLKLLFNGVVPGAISLGVSIHLKTFGRKYAVNTAANVCSPIVSEKMSIIIPLKKAATGSIHFGVSKGNKNMANIYKYGVTKPDRSILLSINTCTSIKKINRSILYPNLSIIGFFYCV